MDEHKAQLDSYIGREYREHILTYKIVNWFYDPDDNGTYYFIAYDQYGYHRQLDAVDVLLYWLGLCEERLPEDE